MGGTGTAVTGTPYAPQSIDFSLADVPSKHVVRIGSVADSVWNNTPGAQGYGYNPVVAGSNPRGQSGQSNNLKSLGLEYNPEHIVDGAVVTAPTVTSLPNSVVLNQNDPSNDNENTIFDLPLAFGPMGYIANHGTNIKGDENGDGTKEFDGGVRVSELQHAYTTGRMNTGENLVVASRDSGSGSGNFFGTTLATGKAYEAGDSRGDITGSDLGPNMGGSPLGSDGVVDAKDIDYVFAQFADEATFGDGDGVAEWLALDEAVLFDLSADIDGDLDVDFDDATELVTSILGTAFGDANLDGAVDGQDFSLLKATFGGNGGWATGDFNGDSLVDGQDFSLLKANFGFSNVGALVVSAADIESISAFAATVPEPASLSLLALASAGFLGRRRR